MPQLLEVNDLKKQFPLKGAGWFSRARGGAHSIRALDGVSLSVSEGETVGIIGESGCGKSTLGHCISRITTPTEGSIRLAGRDIAALSEAEMRAQRRDIQMVFQDPTAALNPRMSVRRMVEEPIRLHLDLTPEGRHEHLNGVLESVGLGRELSERYPHELSGGQRQRVNIARAVATHPKLVILDEPTSALDVSLRARIMLLLEELQGRLGLSYLFISHDIATVKYLADRVVVMYLGVVVEEADKETLFSSPRHPYTQALLSAVPVPDPKVQREKLILSGEIPSPTVVYQGCRLQNRCPLAQKICGEPVPRKEVSPGHHVLCHFA